MKLGLPPWLPKGGSGEERGEGWSERGEGWSERGEEVPSVPTAGKKNNTARNQYMTQQAPTIGRNQNGCLRTY